MLGKWSNIKQLPKHQGLFKFSQSNYVLLIVKAFQCIKLLKYNETYTDIEIITDD